jgi:hypothetical protein
MKLASLPRLHTLILKKNPFLKEKLATKELRYLLSVETDVAIGNDQVHTKIGEVASQHAQILCFNNYLRKISLFIELEKQIHMSGKVANPEVSMFPKIKKIC